MIYDELSVVTLYSQSMNVEFALRSNVTFNGTHDDDSPIHGKAVTFK